MVPSWLHILSLLILALGAPCAATILVDVIRHPQHMGIMNIVWPVTALFGTLITVWGYFRYGRLASREAMMQAKKAGMYGFMAIANFWLFRRVLGARLEVNSPEFWFMMQIEMVCGFITSYPVNWWLLKTGVKEKM